MNAIYNQVAGQSLERLAALSDGIFAVVMTLLVLDLHVPSSEGIHSGQDLINALLPLVPRFVSYFLSFMTLGIFWVGQQTQFRWFARSNRNLTWIHLGFLLAVSLMPFSTALLAEFIALPDADPLVPRLAVVVYWLNILLLGVMLSASWYYAARAGLLKEDTPAEMHTATERRIIVAQSLYAFGALLCIINPYLSIAVIVLVQLNYVIAPRIGPLYRI